MSIITNDLQCIDCGYNVRHAASDGVCSECGTGVAQSIAGDQLVRADQKWLRKIRASFGWLIAGEMLMVVLIVVNLLPIPDALRSWWTPLNGIVFIIASAWGSWRIMIREKRQGMIEVLGRIATVLFVLVLGFAMVLIMPGVVFGPGAVSGAWQVWARIVNGAVLGGFCAMTAKDFFVMLSARSIARRAFASHLRWQCGALAFAQGVTCAFFFADHYAMMTAVASFVETLLQVVMSVTVVWSVIVFWMVRGRISHAITAPRPQPASILPPCAAPVDRRS